MLESVRGTARAHGSPHHVLLSARCLHPFFGRCVCVCRFLCVCVVCVPLALRTHGQGTSAHTVFRVLVHHSPGASAARTFTRDRRRVLPGLCGVIWLVSGERRARTRLLGVCVCLCCVYMCLSYSIHGHILPPIIICCSHTLESVLNTNVSSSHIIAYNVHRTHKHAGASKPVFCRPFDERKMCAYAMCVSFWHAHTC